ncbi:hypothetical protein A0H81_10922 [Grifola frondosa]|uniref:Uncharacterized protein n=1 Tax=Grifola frondosa TaxID=5627 RepID=A0A1C7LX65_GRIFR|nr:hypothetical protein A0H81_10922 [Grifola frondosa]
MGVVFLQIKNDQTYSANMVSGLYDSMDPYKLNYFTKPEDAKVPLIRIVMAVAGRTPALKVRPPPPPPPPPKEDTNDKDKQQEDEKKQEVKTGPFTAYDIWVSG